ncbi:hypothetical protein [Rathayibacter toxicus]|nr:hypothetical protein [Rathayibacter toxicus]QWL48328.1 hypothetical protein E2R43_00910 [Rathayibacter toxicus]QWL52725.1 hypothetical protein E2R45_00910 [Rathayibacter toxicus]
MKDMMNTDPESTDVILGYCTAGPFTGSYISGPLLREEDKSPGEREEDGFSFTWWIEPPEVDDIAEREYVLTRKDGCELLASWRVKWSSFSFDADPFFFDTYPWDVAERDSSWGRSAPLELMDRDMADNAVTEGKWPVAFRKLHTVRYTASFVRDLLNLDEHEFRSVRRLFRWDPAVPQVIDALTARGLRLVIVPRKGVLVRSDKATVRGDWSEGELRREVDRLVREVDQCSDPQRWRKQPRNAFEASGLVGLSVLLVRTQFCFAIIDSGCFRNQVHNVDPWKADPMSAGGARCDPDKSD